MREELLAKSIPVLKETPLFAPLDEAALKSGVAQAGEYGEFTRGEVLFADDGFRPVIGVLLQGKAAVVKGRAVVSVLGPGSVFGAVTLFAQKECYATQITASTGCRALFLPLELIRRWLAETPAFAESYLRYLSHRIYFLTEKIQGFTAGSAEHRLAVHLLNTAQAESDGTLAADLENLSLLARKLDIGRASLYRALDTLIADGAITRNGKTVRITDETKLSMLTAYA